MQRKVIAKTGYPPFKRYICFIFGGIGAAVGILNIELSMHGISSSMVGGLIFFALGIWAIHEGSLTVKLYDNEVLYRKWFKTVRIPVNTATECHEELITDQEIKVKILSISSPQSKKVIRLSAEYLHDYTSFKKAITKQIYGASNTNTFQKGGKTVVRTKKK